MKINIWYIVAGVILLLAAHAQAACSLTNFGDCLSFLSITPTTSTGWTYQESANSYSVDPTPYEGKTIIGYNFLYNIPPAAAGGIWQAKYRDDSCEHVSHNFTIPADCWAYGKTNQLTLNWFTPVSGTTAYLDCYNGNKWVVLGSTSPKCNGGGYDKCDDASNAMSDGNWDVGVAPHNGHLCSTALWSGNDMFFEEAMWWNMPAPITTTTTTQPGAPPTTLPDCRSTGCQTGQQCVSTLISPTLFFCTTPALTFKVFDVDNNQYITPNPPGWISPPVAAPAPTSGTNRMFMLYARASIGVVQANPSTSSGTITCTPSTIVDVPQTICHLSNVNLNSPVTATIGGQTITITGGAGIPTTTLPPQRCGGTTSCPTGYSCMCIPCGGCNCVSGSQPQMVMFGSSAMNAPGCGPPITIPPIPTTTTLPKPCPQYMDFLSIAGCIPSNAQCASDADCAKGGCSGQVCSTKAHANDATTCEWNPEYVCYKNATCGCISGMCTWQNGADVKSCISNVLHSTTTTLPLRDWSCCPKDGNYYALPCYCTPTTTLTPAPDCTTTGCPVGQKCMPPMIGCTQYGSCFGGVPSCQLDITTLQGCLGVGGSWVNNACMIPPPIPTCGFFDRVFNRCPQTTTTTQSTITTLPFTPTTLTSMTTTTISNSPSNSPQNNWFSQFWRRWILRQN